MIFSDATLSQLAKKKPASLEEMKKVSGVGPCKSGRYGETFLKEINSTL